MEGISLREFARLDGCSEALVRKGIKQGKLSKLANGRINPALVGTPWREGNIGGKPAPAAKVGAPAPDKPVGRSKKTTDAIKAAAAAMDITPSPEIAEDDTPLTPEAQAKQLALGLATLFDNKFEADKFAAAYNGALRKIEFDKKSGEVVEIAEVAKQVAEDYRAVKARLLSIPATIAPLVAATRNPAEVKALLEREIISALEELTSDAESGGDQPAGSAQLQSGPGKSSSGDTGSAQGSAQATTPPHAV